jgi:hypothetical protein
MILVSGPLIARLCLSTRKWAHEAITGGRFGSAIEQRGVLYVELDRVAHSLGRIFTDEQIAAATEGRPDRIINIPDYQEEADDSTGSINAPAGRARTVTAD